MEDNKKQKDIINETIINGSRVYVEDGEVKVELSESIQKSGYMTVEEAIALTSEEIKKIYQMNGDL